MIPIVGPAKAFTENAVKVVAKDVAKSFAKTTEEDIAKQVEENIAKDFGTQPYSTSRPSYGKSQVEEVWENAKGRDGLVRDPNTREVLNWDTTQSRYDQWHMGHTPGNDYASLYQKYLNGEISKEEFLKEYRNSSNYRPEAPKENMSHKWE